MESLNMRPIVLAMGRAFWSKGRGYLFSAPAVVLGSILLCHGLRCFDQKPLEAWCTFGTSFWMIPATLIPLVFVASEFHEKRSGFPARLYTLPATTRQLVGIQILINTTAMMLIFLSYACGFRYLVGIWPPLVEPVLLLTGAQAWALAIVWSQPIFKIERLLLGFLIILALGFLFNVCFGYHQAFSAHYSPRGDSSLTLWDPPSWQNIFYLLAFFVTACAVALAEVARDRWGGALGTMSFPGYARRLLDRFSQHRRPFASPLAAQFWLDWHVKGWLLPFGMVLYILALYILRFDCLTESRKNHLGNFGCLVTLFPVTGTLLIGLFLGINFNNFRGELGAFQATRPLNDRILAYTIFKAGAASLLLTWMIGWIALLLAGGIVALDGHGSLFMWQTVEPMQVVALVSKSFFKLGWVSLLPIFALAQLLASWTILSLAITFGLAGHGKAIVIGLLAIMISYFTITIGGPRMLSPQAWRMLSHTGCVLLKLAVPLGVAAAFTLAYRQRLVGSCLFRTALILNILLEVGELALMVNSRTLMVAYSGGPLPSGAVVLGVIALSLAPLALGPLAVHWNRHR
jgi:hypothetical protein